MELQQININNMRADNTNYEGWEYGSLIISYVIKENRIQGVPFSVA